jgi:hypothetical protein
MWQYKNKQEAFVNADSAANEIFNVDGASVVVYRNFMERKAALELFKILRTEIPWKQETVIVDGVQVRPPRCVAILGDKGQSYRLVLSNRGFTEN